MIETERAYVAGLFDGDGSVFFTEHFNKPMQRMNTVLCVGFSMQSKKTLEWLCSRFGGTVLNPARMQRAFTYRATARRAFTILEMVAPYVITKKKQVTFVTWAYPILFKDARGGWGTHKNLGSEVLGARHQCYEILHLLNSEDSAFFHGKSGEFSGNLQAAVSKLLPTITLSQASEGKGSEEGATTREVSPNNNLPHERPTPIH